MSKLLGQPMDNPVMISVSTTRLTRRHGIVRALAASAMLGALAISCGSRHSDSYQLGYDSAVDWVNANDTFILSQSSSAGVACADFERYAKMSLDGGKTYEQSMRFVYIGDGHFTDQQVPADLSSGDFQAGCFAGIDSQANGVYVRKSDDAATTQAGNASGLTSVTGEQLGKAMATYSAGMGVATSSFDCPGGPYGDGDTANCIFVRADNGAKLSLTVGVHIENGEVNVEPGTPVLLAGGS